MFSLHLSHILKQEILSYVKKLLVNFCELFSICGKFLTEFGLSRRDLPIQYCTEPHVEVLFFTSS